jgi:predicted nucleic acid-binding protein
MCNGDFRGMIEIAVIDSGPLIHLDELDCLDLVEGFTTVYVPIEVIDEVVIHRPNLKLDVESTTPKFKISNAGLSSRVANYARDLDLDAGEVAALNLLEGLRGQLFLCDDAAARLAAESMGYKVHGTVGLIVRAIRRGTRSRTEVKRILESIPAQSSRTSARLCLTA